ncbi:MAG: uroporphyrinogen decarboxylase [Proteobacteria bacterium]|nr:uroporphyrinogen decarboxylase [Pseudomonadota bacterium]
MTRPAKPLLQVLAGARVDPPPIWLMRQAGRYLPEYREVRATAGDFLTLCYTPDLAVEVTLQPIRRYGLDAAILFSDILVIPDALGRQVAFREGEGPVLTPLRHADEIDRLDPERIVEHLAPVYETVSRLAAALPETVTLIGFAGAPWTVAAYMVEGRGGSDFASLVKWAWREPESFGRLIHKLVDATVLHLLAQIEAGVEAVQLFDSWAGIAAEPLFRHWCLDPAAEIIARLRDKHPGVPVIAFPRGAGPLLADFARETGAAAVGLDTAVPLHWAAAALPATTVLQGNLDPAVLATGGPSVAAEVGRILDALGGRPHIFNLGHGIRKETDPETVAALVRAVRGPR